LKRRELEEIDAVRGRPRGSPGAAGDYRASLQSGQCTLDRRAAAAGGFREISGACAASVMRWFSSRGEVEEDTELDFGEAWGDAG